jgi:hypothetical protein
MVLLIALALIVANLPPQKLLNTEIPAVFLAPGMLTQSKAMVLRIPVAAFVA